MVRRHAGASDGRARHAGRDGDQPERQDDADRAAQDLCRECEEGESSNIRILEGSKGISQSDCYHIIEITAQQWFWSFDCLDLASEICDTDIESMEVYGSVPELFLKRGETYLANMTSLDVTHAPWFQHLGTKEDTVPGQNTQLWLPIPLEMSDESMILCAEYCGDAHSVMAGKLSIHD